MILWQFPLEPCDHDYLDCIPHAYSFTKWWFKYFINHRTSYQLQMSNFSMETMFPIKINARNIDTTLSICRLHHFQLANSLKTWMKCLHEVIVIVNLKRAKNFTTYIVSKLLDEVTLHNCSTTCCFTLQ